MIRPDQIPDEVVEAAAKTYMREPLREAIAAALNAWPNITRAKWSDRTFILPLPEAQQETENSDE